MDLRSAKGYYKDAKRFKEVSSPKVDDENESYVIQKSTFEDSKKMYEDARSSMNAYIRNSDAFRLVEDILRNQNGKVEELSDGITLSYIKAYTMSEEDFNKFFNDLNDAKSYSKNLLISDPYLAEPFLVPFNKRMELEKIGAFTIQELDVENCDYVTPLDEDTLKEIASRYADLLKR